MNYETPDVPLLTETADVDQLPENVVRAMRVWLNLSETERESLKQTTERFNGLHESGREQLREIIINVRTYPYETSCPYCGRS
jgi:hypothetical protein